MAHQFSVSRRRVIAAPADRVFAQVVDFAHWVAWSPWEGMDPDMKRTYSDRTSGVGATYGWLGNRKVGEGGMAITEVVENERIAIDLSFIKPFKAENKTLFEFRAVDGGTEVSWSMTGELNFLMRIMGIFMPMDKMVGPDFEKGLRQLAEVVEA